MKIHLKFLECSRSSASREWYNIGHIHRKDDLKFNNVSVHFSKTAKEHIKFKVGRRE